MSNMLNTGRKVKGSKSKRQNNRVKGVLRENKARKKTEALERQKVYNSLTLEQKLAKAKVGSKEYIKLIKLQEQQNERK